MSKPSLLTLYPRRVSNLLGVTIASAALQSTLVFAADSTNALPSVVITGSMIPTAATETATPVLVLDRATIERQPVRNVSELLRRLPEANATGVPEFGNGTGFETGASAVSLRGFGAEATLVLINGRRVVGYGDGQNGTDSFVDLNSIPLSMVDRIEVLKDGASAIYGADAVAGVVNILTKHKYRGGEIVAGYGNTTTKDSSETSISAIFGTGDEKTDVYATVNFLRRNAMFNRDRDYSAIVDRRSLGGVDAGSRNSVPGVYIIPRSVAEALPGVIVTSDSSLWNNPGVIPADSGTTVAVSAGNNVDWSGGPGSVPASAFYYGTSRSDLQDRNFNNVPRFNFNQFSGQVPYTERKGFASEIEHKIIDEKLRFFSEVMYQNVITEEVLAPGPLSNFGAGNSTPVVIPATSPWNPFGVDISGSSSFRPVEFGNRVTEITTDWARIVAGLRGTLLEKWEYEGAFLWNESRTTKVGDYASASAFSSIMDPANTGSQLPYNPFVGLVHPLALNGTYDDAVSVKLRDQTRTELMSGDFKVSTMNLCDLWAGPIGLATGGEWRQEKLKTSPDTLSAGGDVVGSSQQAAYKASRDVHAWFGELRVPLISEDKDVRGFHSVSLNVAGRLEDYSDAGFAGVPKVALEWRPIDEQLLLRASWSQGFKAPSLFEMYHPGNFALQVVDNPYNGEQGVEADILRVGNPDLKPEDSESVSFGFVYSPKWCKGLTIHADFWRTERTGIVDSADFQVLLDRAYANDPNPLNANDAFDPSENILMDLNDDGSINLMGAPFSNTAKLVGQGIDFGASYELMTDKAGTFTLASAVSYLDSFKGQDNSNTPVEELVGQAFSDASDAYVQWRGTASLWWEYKRYSLGITGNYIGSYADATPTPRDVDAYLTMDLQAKVNLPYDFAVTVGCNNVLDTDPPLTLAPDISAADGYIPALYNPLGRFVYFQVSKKF